MQKKKLGFGMMRLPIMDPNDLASVDLEKTKEMVDVFMERGFTYFDTAWMYCGFNSENIVRQAVVERYPRESFTVTTKLHAAYLKADFFPQCILQLIRLVHILLSRQFLPC
mgnify:CR=1 FL=1